MVLFLGTVLWVDTLNTRYLKIDPSDSASSNSYLITHANIVPMNQDTVLMNKSIYVENGVIEEIGDTLMVEGIPTFNGEKYAPAIYKGWNTLVEDCMHPNGFLGYVQGTGDEPSSGQPVTYDSMPDFEDYGLGMFLLAGTEVYKMNG